jgi:hypothetical protein
MHDLSSIGGVALGNEKLISHDDDELAQLKVAARAAKTNHSKALGSVAKMILRLLMPIATRTFMSAEKTLGAEQRYRIEWHAVVS